MLVEIHGSEDLHKLEHAICLALGAQRLDVSVLRSRPYIELRQSILRNQVPVPATTYFPNENLVIRVLQKYPLLLWCGHRDPDTEETSCI